MLGREGEGMVPQSSWGRAVPQFPPPTPVLQLPRYASVFPVGAELSRASGLPFP